MEGAFGTETEIEVEKREVCPTCEGSGCEQGTHPETCRQCNGTGQAMRTQGFFSISTTCPTCNGGGQTILHPCDECRGAGQVMARKKVAVKIPGGVDSGSRLRLTGEGEPGAYGGPPGDLYVFIHVEPHDFFRRDNTDVICQADISFVQAALGDTITVPTLKANKTLEIPKGTQFGDVFRNPDLADMFERIGAYGAREFYAGQIAERIVAFSEEHSSVVTASRDGTLIIYNATDGESAAGL